MFGHHPRIWALTAGVFALIGTYGVLIGILGATFWPPQISSSESVVALPLAFVVAVALGSVVRYHLLHGINRLPAENEAIGRQSFPRRIKIAFFVLFAYVGLTTGEGLTVLIYGNEGPFSHAFSAVGTHSPILPVWTWPLVFAMGAGLMQWICWSAMIQDRESGLQRSGVRYTDPQR